MKKKTRVKRPKLPRTEPLRDFSTLFGEPRRPSASAKARSAGSPDFNGAVERGVELGYRVIDEYVRQGRAIAGTFRRSAPRAAPESDMQRVAERMMHNASELAGAWLEFVRTAAAGGTARSAETPSGAAPDPFAPPNAPDSAEAVPSRKSAAPSIAVEVVTKRPASVRVDLKRGFSGPVDVHDLRNGSKKGRISGAATLSQSKSGQCVVRVVVPDSEPPGTYSGALVERSSSSTVGTLTLRIRP